MGFKLAVRSFDEVASHRWFPPRPLFDRDVPISCWEFPIERWDVPGVEWDIPIGHWDDPVERWEVPIERWDVPGVEWDDLLLSWGEVGSWKGQESGNKRRIIQVYRA